MIHLREARPNVFAWLRAVGQSEAAIVYAGTSWDWVQVVEQAAKSPGSSFGNDVTTVRLGAIDRGDAIQFLRDVFPAEMANVEVATRIVDVCGPWPFYLQVMGHAVVQAVNLGNRLALVERRGVEDLYEVKLLADRDAVFRDRWKELPPKARALVLGDDELAPPPFSGLRIGEQELVCNAGIATPLEGWLDDRPFFDWVRRHQQALREVD